MKAALFSKIYKIIGKNPEFLICPEENVGGNPEASLPPPPIRAAPIYATGDTTQEMIRLTL